MPDERKLKKCFKEGERGKERHKGLKKISISRDNVKSYLDKAIHNFKAMIAFQKIGFSDWSASAAFYTLYHCLLALAAKEGYESRNQNCTFMISAKNTAGSERPADELALKTIRFFC